MITGCVPVRENENETIFYRFFFFFTYNQKKKINNLQASQLSYD